MDQTVVFESDPPASANEQLGGRLALTRDGYLFLSLGDRWEPHRAQNLSYHAGSIIRIHPDGSVPSTNPFVSVPGAKPTSGRTATGTRKGSSAMTKPDRCGPLSTARKVGMNSTSFSPAGTTAGRWSVTA